MISPLDYAQANADRFLDEFLDLVRIPSISTLTEHRGDVRRAAEWLRADMLRIGFDTAELITMPEGRHPLVLGEWVGAGEHAPTVLIYSHYDVQPALVEDGWNTDPFEPTERDGKIYARGATDSKIHVIAQLKAAECLLAAAEKPSINIKFIFEGEEESGGETIKAFVEKYPERLRADVCVISDGPIIGPGQPSLTYGLRGIVTLELHVTGPAQDLHSGHWGGNVHNPVQALAEILAQLHDQNGRVTVPGFYDNARLLDDEERILLAEASRRAEKAWKSVTGAPRPWGEPEFTLLERASTRPTLEINGILGGYTGEGVKTVLPAKAMAKISCRLVPDQDPDRIAQLVQDYLAQVTPPTVKSEIRSAEMGAPAVLLDRSSKAMQAARAAYQKAWGVEPLFERAGGSVPITFAMQKVAKEIVLMGFTYQGGRAHGPNENIIVEMFHKGVETAIHFYHEYAR